MCKVVVLPSKPNYYCFCCCFFDGLTAIAPSYRKGPSEMRLKR